METQSGSANHLPPILRRLLPAVGPGLLISVAYVDPGKWAATVEGGARFGVDLVLPMLIFNLAAILCQYLSAKVGIITGRDLAQICSEEYDKFTCMFLGVQTAISVAALDLSMILGIAHGLNLLLGVDLPTCIFLTAGDAVLFPFFAAFLEKHKGYFPSICVAGFVLLFYFLGVLISQPEVPLSNGISMKLSEESAFALMSLLGASIMPHNFYMHSSIVLHHQKSPNVSKSASCYDNFFAILCIFSGIYLVNYVLMNSAANVFHSTGLVLVTFPDAMSLMEQVFRSPVAPLFFVVILYLSNQISALTWNIGGQVVLNDFLSLDIPNWLQRATTRIVAIVPALYCVWTSGVEGAYQLLIFSQVLVALLLPASVIPLFRIASSRTIMGTHKISQFLEFLAVVAFTGMLGLKIIFVVEMIFGDSDWIGNLRWNMGSSSSLPYVVLLATAFLSFCLMLWLAATPLKSATTQVDAAQSLSWDPKQTVQEPSMRIRDEKYLGGSRYGGEGHVHKQEAAAPTPVKSFMGYTDRSVFDPEPHLPETILESREDFHLTPIEENQPDMKFPCPLKLNQESAPSTEPIPVSKAAANVVVASSLDHLPDSKMKVVEALEPVEKTVNVEGDFLGDKEDDEGDTWGEPEEPSSKGIPGSVSSLTSDGPASFRSLSGKSDDGGNGAGSLSRLAGLGRAARRQLATVLDEFWGQLYDFHGQATQDAKNRRIDLLLAADSSKLSSFSFLKVDTPLGKEYNSGYNPSAMASGRGSSDSFMNTSFCDSPRQQQLMMQQGTLESSSYGGVAQRVSSSLWPNRSQLLDSYLPAPPSSSVVVDPSERRYSSMRSLPPSSDGWDNQPATIHGYQIASIANRIAKERSANGLNGRMESLTPISSSTSSMWNYRDPHAGVVLGQRLQNGLSSPQQAPAGYQNLAPSRNNSLQSERQYYDVVGSPVSVVDNAGPTTTSTKKYHSLPDISGIAAPYRELYLSGKSNAQLDNNSVGGFGSSLGGRTSYDPSFYGDAFSFPTAPATGGSLWSKQPFEQFGVGDKSRAVLGSSALGGGSSRPNSTTHREASSSIVDAEAQLLRSFRCCIVKLLKLEGSDWLFRQNDGADEDLIDRVAARERCLYEAEAREMGQHGGLHHLGVESQCSSDKKQQGGGSGQKNDEANSIANILVSSVPHCGEGCVWKVDLIVSFGVWCIHRVLDLSLMESRPELWGKYTYVLNRLQGVVEPAFMRPRTPMQPCFCLQLSAAHQQRLLSPQAAASNGMLPPTVKPGRGGKCTTAGMVLDLIKDVEIAISCRKGRSGTAAGDVAFPKGKENLASVLKRYKRRLSNKAAGK